MSRLLSFFLFSLFVIVGVAGTVFSAQAVTCPPPAANWTIVGGVCVPTTAGTGLSSASVFTVAVTVMLWLLGLANVLGILAFVVSGIQYLTAVGDEDQISTAKRNMKYAIIGIVVTLSGYMIVTAIDRIFAGNAAF